jgi:hypothetical protein
MRLFFHSASTISIWLCASSQDHSTPPATMRWWTSSRFLQLATRRHELHKPCCPSMLCSELPACLTVGGLSFPPPRPLKAIAVCGQPLSPKLRQLWSMKFVKLLIILMLVYSSIRPVTANHGKITYPFALLSASFCCAHFIAPYCSLNGYRSISGPAPKVVDCGDGI